MVENSASSFKFSIAEIFNEAYNQLLLFIRKPASKLTISICFPGYFSFDKNFCHLVKSSFVILKWRDFPGYSSTPMHVAWATNRRSWKPLCSRVTMTWLPSGKHGGMTHSTWLLQCMAINVSKGKRGGGVSLCVRECFDHLELNDDDNHQGLSVYE